MRERGYVTRLSFLLGRSVSELEDILGFGKGRLAGGYTLLLLADTVHPNDFQFRGMTYFPDGVPSGETSQTETLIRDSLSRYPADKGRFAAMKVAHARDVFVTSGINRIAKVKAHLEGGEYPPGSGAPQWELINQKEFAIGAVVAPSLKVFRRADDSLYVAERAAGYS